MPTDKLEKTVKGCAVLQRSVLCIYYLLDNIWSQALELPGHARK